MSPTRDASPVTLLDHFRPPLSARRHWHAFHNAWATYLASDLNTLLPEGYFAESNVQFGIEIDVAAFEDEMAAAAIPDSPTGAASLTAVWSPPAPTLAIPFVPAGETVEVRVFDAREGPVLAGAIELVSPANKDRPSHRGAFVSKCEAYLQSGTGLVVVDVVTNRLANLHHALVERLSPAHAPLAGPEMYAAAYRAIEQDGTARIDIWQEALGVGSALPIIPLWLRGGLCLPVDLAASYGRTCAEQRLFVRATWDGPRPVA